MGEGRQPNVSEHIEAIQRYLTTLPYQARLDYFELSHAERSLIRAMCSCSPPAGAAVWLPIRALGARANLSRKTVQRVIYGWTDSRSGEVRTGLKARGILTETAKASRGKRRAATYRVNWDAFMLDPAHIGILERRMQMCLPGMKRPAVQGESSGAFEQLSPLTAVEGQHSHAGSAKTPLALGTVVPDFIPGTQQARSFLQQPALHLPVPGTSGGDSLPVGRPVGIPVDKHSQASGTSVTVTHDMDHGDASHASRCRPTCVTVTPRVFDSSSSVSKEFSNRSSRPAVVSPQVEKRKTGWDKLPPGLQRRVLKELKLMAEASVGSSRMWDDETPSVLRTRVLIACDRAGIWPHVTQQIVDDWYPEYDA